MASCLQADAASRAVRHYTGSIRSAPLVWSEWWSPSSPGSLPRTRLDFRIGGRRFRIGRERRPDQPANRHVIDQRGRRLCQLHPLMHAAVTGCGESKLAEEGANAVECETCKRLRVELC